MNKIDVLSKLYNNKTSIKKTYKQLYKLKKPRKSYFIKLRMFIPEEKAATILIRILFFLPIPIFIIKFILKRSDKYINGKYPIPIKISELVDLMSVKGAHLDVHTSEDIKIKIKTI